MKKEYTKEELKEIATSLVYKYKEFKRNGESLPIIKEKGRSGTMDLGTFVTIRSCRKKDSNDLRLGVYLGGVPTSLGHNPAFYVFGLKDIILGMESWWGSIPEEDLNLSCDTIKKKYGFTRKDIIKEVEQWIDHAKKIENELVGEMVKK